MINRSQHDQSGSAMKLLEWRAANPPGSPDPYPFSGPEESGGVRAYRLELQSGRERLARGGGSATEIRTGVSGRRWRRRRRQRRLATGDLDGWGRIAVL